MRTAARCAVLFFAVAVGLPVLVASRLIIRYDRLSRGQHADMIRRVIPWRGSVWAAALPLTALSWTLVPDPRSDMGDLILAILWLGAILAFAEVYSVCLHREAWIAAFEPWHLPDHSKPLGARPPSIADRRLHYLVRIQLIYSVAPLATGLAISWNAPLPAIAATFFMAKFHGHASSDYEVFYHWNLHLKILAMPGAPRRSRCVQTLVDWYLGPLHGYVPNIYRAEHLLIHHPENSGPNDVNSPLPYRRTSLLEFCIFALRTSGSLLFGARIITHRRCRRRTRRAMAVGIVVHWSVVAILLWRGELLGAWMMFLTVHHAVSSARSQYEWHAFIDPARPRDPVGSTMIWVYGQRRWEDVMTTHPAPRTEEKAPDPGVEWAFYDNNHLLHHLHPRAHYLDYPALMERRLPELVARGAVVLDLAGLDQFAIDCWSNDLERLEAMWLAPRTENVKLLIRHRLAPDPAIRSPYGTICESLMAKKIDRWLVRVLKTLSLT